MDVVGGKIGQSESFTHPSVHPGRVIDSGVRLRLTLHTVYVTERNGKNLNYKQEDSHRGCGDKGRTLGIRDISELRKKSTLIDDCG